MSNEVLSMHKVRSELDRIFPPGTPPVRKGKDSTNRARRIMEFIAAHRTQKRRSPTFREIGAQVGISSTSVVSYYINRLAKRGLLRIDREVSRGVSLTAAGAAFIKADPRDTVVRCPHCGTEMA